MNDPVSSRRLWRSCLRLHLLVLLGVEPALLDRRSHPPHVLLHVLAVQLGGLCVRGAVGVRVVEETLDGGEDGGDVVCGGPAVLEDVQTEFPFA